MLKYILYLIVCVTLTLFTISCNWEQTPVVFTKITEDSEMSITLDTNNTFTHKASHTHGAKFNEQGKYTIIDSLLILNYTNDEYSYNCYTIPLPNDTLLFGRYKDKTLLYTLYTIIPGIDSILTKQEVMQRIVNQYNNPNFPSYIGTFIFECSSNNASQLYSQSHKISKYYDTFITNNE